MSIIEINGAKKLEVKEGRSLLEALRGNNIPVPTVCGGRGICGVCKVKVLSGGGPVQHAETRLLTEMELAGNVRLSCQVRVSGDIEVEIPDELLSVRRYRARCGQIEDLTYDVKRFRLKLAEPDRMKFTAGQYVQLTCPAYAKGVEPVSRAYSIASDTKENNFIDLIIRKVPNGICTTWCFEYLKEGDEVVLTGPYGNFGLTDGDWPMVFVAGGSGIAPFVSILHTMVNDSSARKAEFFFGGNTVKDLCLLEQMRGFEKTLSGFTFIPVAASPQPQDNWRGQTGLVTDAVKRHYQDLSGYEGYLCGSPGMIDASVRVFAALGMPQERIFYDKFA